jgi:hypothetical protein
MTGRFEIQGVSNKPLIRDCLLSINLENLLLLGCFLINTSGQAILFCGKFIGGCLQKKASLAGRGLFKLCLRQCAFGNRGVYGSEAD